MQPASKAVAVTRTMIQRKRIVCIKRRERFLEQIKSPKRALSKFQAVRPQQFLYFFPLPHGHGSFRPTLGKERRRGKSIDTSPAPSPSIATPANATTGCGCRARAGAFAVGAVGAYSC